jgi:hypothetical protein
MSVLFCQSSGLSIYGVGERIDNVNPISIGVGGANYFAGNSKNINNDSSSSIWRSALTRFSIHSGMNFLKINNSPEQYQHSLTSFSMFFPIGNKKVFGFGIEPIFRTNSLKILDAEFSFIGSDSSISNKPIAYKNNYSIDGGISQLFFTYSQKVDSYFSYGLRYSFLFGNQILSDELYTYDIIVDTSGHNGLLIDEINLDSTILFVSAENATFTEVNKYKDFKGASISLEGRYKYHAHEFVLEILAHNKNSIKVNTEQKIDNFSTETSSLFSSKKIATNVGLGYKYDISKQSGIILEFHHDSPFNIPKSVSLFNILPPEEKSYHTGVFYRYPNSKIGFWNNIIYRSGIYYKNKIFSDTSQFIDFGFTIGIGIEYINNSQSIDIGIRIGNKESLSFIGKDEKYISLHIGLTTGEKWFMKRRRK